MKKRFLAMGLALCLLLSGCGGENGEVVPTLSAVETTGAASETPTVSSDVFSDRDQDDSYEEKKSTVITLSGDSASCDSNAVRIDGTTVTITDEGTYILSGTLEDGMIIVNTEKKDKTQIVLDGVSIHSQSSAAIYILQSDKVFITLAEGSENTLSNGGSFEAIDENNIDAVIFSKEDVTFNGAGSLTVTSPAGHGIVSKDSLTVTGGNYTVSAASHGLAGKDDVSIAAGTFTIVSGKDGIHAENDDDAALGYVYIEGGVFDITAEGDGISAASYLQIVDGAFGILCGGGSVNGQQKSSDKWGMGGFGGRPGMGGDRSGSNSQTEEDSTSIKGIKAGTDLDIYGGSFVIDTADDAVHSNGNLTVSGGTFQVSTGDDGFHAEENLAVTDGTIHVSESYEGLEGLHIDISGGDITLYATDDGLNAAGGTDQSGFGGRDNGQFGGGMGRMGSGSILISGGTIYVNASGDGIDANGTLEISGGHTTVCGPTQGDTATLDYDISGTISGGTFIGTGAAAMAQTFSDTQQGVIAVSAGNQPAGTLITLTDSSGNTVISYSPELPFAVVILSAPEIVKGQTYTITVGSASGDFQAG